MKILIYSLITSLFISLVLGKLLLPVLRSLKIGQPILKYVNTHKDKNGTPTMGGLFFIISAIISFAIFGGLKSRIALVSAVIGLAFMVVGFLDDFIKIKTKNNQGLKAYQKILFQVAIALSAGFFAFDNGITLFHIPFNQNAVNLGVFTVPVVALIFVAITNSVNLTDGLDGLAGGVSVVYLIILAVLIGLQTVALNTLYLLPEEYYSMQLFAVCVVGALLGFLVFNVSKAKVFMGDTGSLALGGIIGSLSVFSSNSFFIPLIGITFVLSSISVIVQVFFFKITKKRVFLMAPLHHHFQMKGYSEAKISYLYVLITIVVGLISIISYL